MNPADISRAPVGNGLTLAPNSAIPLRLPVPARIAMPIYEPGIYGDLSFYPCVLTAAGNYFAIPRPAAGAKRVFLVVVNELAAGNTIRVNFGAEATALAGMPIPAGGNLFLDRVVPQQDVHIFMPIAGRITCFYMNQDVKRPDL